MKHPITPSVLKALQLIQGYSLGRFVRIASLNPVDKPQIAAHLLSLSSHDRYLRFGYIASDEHIQAYVDGLNFVRDHLYGIYSRTEDRKTGLVAVAHVTQMSEPYQTPFSFGIGASHSAEFGVSVLPAYRGKGYGGRLFNRAVIHSRNQGISEFHIQALSENAQMLRIAKRRGATLVQLGSETEAHLLLPKADFDSRMSELVAEHFGNVDYSKAHGQRWTQTMTQLMQQVQKVFHTTQPLRLV